MCLINCAVFLPLMFYSQTLYGHKLEFHNPEGLLNKIWPTYSYCFCIETSTPIVYPVGPTARYHGRLFIKYWANRTAPTTTMPNSEFIHTAIENYLNHKQIISRVDDFQLHTNLGSSNVLHVSDGTILFLIIFIIFYKEWLYIKIICI